MTKNDAPAQTSTLYAAVFGLIFFCPILSCPILSASSANADPPSSVCLTALATKLQQATVRIDTGRDVSSGVLISASGLILTVAHGISASDRSVSVVLHDGRRADADVVKRDPVRDVALLKFRTGLTKSDAFIEMAHSNQPPLRKGAVVLSSGFPARDKTGMTAVVRIGSVVAVTNKAIRSTCALTVGDSGGPMLNAAGMLVGIHQKIGLGPSSNLHLAIEFCRNAMKGSITVDESVTSSVETTAQANPLADTIIDADADVTRRCQKLTVRLNHDADEKTPLWGTLISSYLVAAKLSLVGPDAPTSVTFTDGTQVGCTTRFASHADDLLILTLKERKPQPVLPSVPTTPCSRGDRFDVVFAGQHSQAGIISRTNHSEPGLKPKLGCELSLTSVGLLVTRVFPESAASDADFRVNDRLERIGDVRLASLADVVQVLESFQPGDYVPFSVRRGINVEVRSGRLRHDANELLQRAEFLDGRSGQLSDRRSGFSGVLQHDAALAASEMGTPLLSRSGALIAVNIARRSRESVLATPVERILALLPADRDSDATRSSEPD